MPDVEFVKLVWQMRSAQRIYGKVRTQSALQSSRDLERDVDHLIEALLQPRAAPSVIERLTEDVEKV